MNWAKILLEIADKDLEAAKCLYDKELYPQSIFYLQQSVEKAAKSFGLVMGIISENELKGREGVGHHPYKIYKKLFSMQKKSLKKINEGIKKAPNVKELPLIKTIDLNKIPNETDELLNFFDDLRQGEDIFFLSNEEIEGWIEDLNKLKAEVEELNEGATTFSISNEEFDRVKQGVLKSFDALYEYKPQKIEKMRKVLDNAITPDQVEEMIKMISPPLNDGVFVSVSLLYLSIITFPHVVSRYPNDDFNPLEIYNRDLPIIQSFNELNEIMEGTLFKMGNLLRLLIE